jgi:hypothetical protein
MGIAPNHLNQLIYRRNIKINSLDWKKYFESLVPQSWSGLVESTFAYPPKCGLSKKKTATRTVSKAHFSFTIVSLFSN